MEPAPVKALTAMSNPIVLRAISLLGLVMMMAIAWAMSEDRRRVSWRIVGWGLGLQFAFALLVLRTGFGLVFFETVRSAFLLFTDATREGARFLFGTLTEDYQIGAIMAFQVLPVIVFVSALAGVLQHLGVIQVVVRGMAWLMRRTMKTSGAETFAASLLVFMGIEAVTGIRGYVRAMTRSELCTVLTTFMATIAASVMVVYASFGAKPGHLLAASLMSAPAAILISKLMVPETGSPETAGNAAIVIPVESHNVVDAAARGASDGLQLALNVGAMLVAFIGLVYLADRGIIAVTGVTLSNIMGWIFVPFAWVMGVAPDDVVTVAQLLGKKTILNEFLAYADLKPLIEQGAISQRSITIATYALCGFANPGSLGIMMGAATALMPERRGEVAALGLKAFVGGTLAAFMTACVAGIIVNA